jgi:hypothetical protein
MQSGAILLLNFHSMTIFDLFIEEIDEENIEDAIYTQEDQVTKMGKPLERVEVGNQKMEQDGAYKLKFIKKGGSNKQLEVESKDVT